VGAGELGRKQVAFAYSQPLNETWVLRITDIKSEEEGFIKNIYNNRQ
jgi:hypothetical protein|tara:strand:- start:11236 stop:11376 length:141 start_codon:yes stop_codon:yes gene_type:complete